MRLLAFLLIVFVPHAAFAQSDRPQYPAASVPSARQHSSCAVSVPVEPNSSRRVTFVIDCVSGAPLPIPDFDGLSGCSVEPSLVPPEAGRRLDTSAVRLAGECSLLGNVDGRLGRFEHGAMRGE